MTPMVRRTASGSLATSWPAMMARPAGEGNKRRHHANESALAGAVGTEQAEDFAVGHGKVDAFDGFKRAVTLDGMGSTAMAAGGAVERSLLHQLAPSGCKPRRHVGNEVLAVIGDE